MSKIVKVKDCDLLIHNKNRNAKKWKKSLAKYSKHLGTKRKNK